MQFLFESLMIGILSGIIAAVYRGVLAYEPILNWWFRFGNRFEKKWFFKPIWGCVLCISGQIALWATVLIEVVPAISTHYRQISAIAGHPVEYIRNPFALIFGAVTAVCAAIVVSGFFYQLLNQKNESEAH